MTMPSSDLTADLDGDGAFTRTSHATGCRIVQDLWNPLPEQSFGRHDSVRFVTSSGGKCSASVPL